jgi:uncharacterized membrane protein
MLYGENRFNRAKRPYLGDKTMLIPAVMLVCVGFGLTFFVSYLMESLLAHYKEVSKVPETVTGYWNGLVGICLIMIFISSMIIPALLLGMKAMPFTFLIGMACYVTASLLARRKAGLLPSKP